MWWWFQWETDNNNKQSCRQREESQSPRGGGRLDSLATKAPRHAVCCAGDCARQCRCARPLTREVDSVMWLADEDQEVFSGGGRSDSEAYSLLSSESSGLGDDLLNNSVSLFFFYYRFVSTSNPFHNKTSSYLMNESSCHFATSVKLKEVCLG